MAGSQCCENPPTLSSSSGFGGEVEIFGGLKAYIAGSANRKAAILLVSDVFGFEAPNLRKLADITAAAGFFVVVPDFFNGDYYDPDKIPIATWIGNHNTDKGYEDAKAVVAALKSKGFSAVGASGFCWGAKVVAELAKSSEIKAGVMLHPSFVTLDDIKANKAHLAILGAEIDQISPPELVKQFEEILSSNSGDLKTKWMIGGGVEAGVHYLSDKNLYAFFLVAFISDFSIPMALSSCSSSIESSEGF